MTTPPPAPQRNGWLWVCVAGLLLAAGVRLWHIDFGLPEISDVDAFKFVDAARHIGEAGSLEPFGFESFQYPGGYTHTLALIYKLGGLSEPYATHVVARLLSVAGGLGMVGGAWWLARRLGGGFAACVAVLLTALSVDGVTASHVVCTDTLTACWMTLALAVAIAPAPDWRSWLGAGALVGLAAGTKFSGACVGPFVVLAAVVSGVRARRPLMAARDVGLVCLGAVAVFWLTTPRFPWDFWGYVDRLRFEGVVQRFGQLGHIQYGWFDYLVSSTTTPEQPWLYTSLLWNAGPLVLLVAAAAVLAALAGRGGQPAVLVALYVVGYLALISGPGHLKAARFLLLILPALFALSGWWLESLLTWLPSERGKRIASVGLLVALAAWPAYRSTRYLALLGQPPTNTLVREWVIGNVPRGAKVFVSPFYLVDLSYLPIQCLGQTNVAGQQYRLPEPVGSSPERTLIYSPETVDVIAANQVEYAVLNSYFEDGLAPTPENLRWFPRSTAGYAAFREALAARADEVHTILGFRAGRCGPDITIYRWRK